MSGWSNPRPWEWNDCAFVLEPGKGCIPTVECSMEFLKWRSCGDSGMP